jgi:hypothetical protein
MSWTLRSLVWEAVNDASYVPWFVFLREIKGLQLSGRCAVKLDLKMGCDEASLARGCRVRIQ